MRRFTAVALVALLFVTGVIVGVIGTHAFYAHRVREPDRLIELGSSWQVQSLRRELDLTPDQERRVRELLRQTRLEIQQLRDEMMPEVRARIEAAHNEFVGVLDPEQRQRLREVMRRHGRRYMRAFGFPHEGGSGRHFRHGGPHERLPRLPIDHLDHRREEDGEATSEAPETDSRPTPRGD